MKRTKSWLQRLAEWMDAIAADIPLVSRSARRLYKAATEAVTPLLPWLLVLALALSEWWREWWRGIAQTW